MEGGLSLIDLLCGDLAWLVGNFKQSEPCRKFNQSKRRELGTEVRVFVWEIYACPGSGGVFFPSRS